MKWHTYRISLWGVSVSCKEREGDRERDDKRESDTGVVYIA